ncbi:uncharacterized protein DEA37_0007689 [Paragonimus westermani]|uniref:Peptidase A2 domain-containing protein n=1 Tax=Paragonimus westermani TaxID=34504 RepID=A0A5J4NV23_9TREM|nr:uncharacterized protein DEA37_0007689 [Paragonimus westermani]
MIPIRVVGPTEGVLTYALLDSSSDTTLVSQALIGRLNFTGKPSEVRVTTITGSQVIPGRTVALEIRSLDGEDEVAVELVHSVPSLQMKPPIDAIRNEICKCPHPEGASFGKVPDKRVSILIGNGVPEAHWVLDQRPGDRKQSYAVKRLLGWILLGPLGSYERGLSAVNCLGRGPCVRTDPVAKLLLQKLCEESLGWDDPIQPNDAKTWNEWLAHVMHMNPVEVPRCITRDATDYFNGAQLHVFSDASKTGYGAAAYAPLFPKAGQPYCTPVIAKSRVTPMKTVTIPRLELNAAVLAVKIEKLVSTDLQKRNLLDRLGGCVTLHKQHFH